MVIFLGLFFGILFMLIGGLIGFGVGEEILRVGAGLAVLGGLGGFGLGAYIGAAIGRVPRLEIRIKDLEARLSEMQRTINALKREAEKPTQARETEKAIPNAEAREVTRPISREEKIQALEARMGKLQTKMDASPPKETGPPGPHAWNGPRPISQDGASQSSEQAVHPSAPDSQDGAWDKPVKFEKKEPAPTPAPTPPPISPRPMASSRPEFRPLPNSSASMFKQSLDFVGTFLKDFFTTGNVVARIGIIVLFFGVAFLLKYATTRYHVSIEYRFIAVAIFALVMTGLGFWLRETKRIFALLLQGGGIGILYMTVYFAAKPYHLIPLPMAFGVMVGLVGLSGAVAVFQDARATAFMGMAGGFLAPVLTSSGAGNHVLLFSYYAILGLGILGVAWQKSWRELNLLGFFFTFGVATLWGVNNYKPALFATTEPFLVVFFVFYETIAVLYALRQPLHLRGFVDGTLVFGTPIVAFALQAALIRHINYGLAYSALGAAVFYLVLTKALWRKQIPGMQVLTESFLALCVVFVSLAIPLGLSGKWTSAVYAFEGAGLIWIGLRQNRLLARCFGLLLQLGGAFFLLDNLGHSRHLTPVVNSDCLGFAFIALGGLFSSYFHYKHKDETREVEKPLHFVLLAWGVVWWLAGGLREAELHVPHTMDYWEAAAYTANIVLLFVAATALAMHILIKKLGWKAMGYALVCYVPALVLFFWLGIEKGFYHDNPADKLGWAAWPIALAASYFILKMHENTAPEKAAKMWHAIGFWVLTALAASQAAWCLQTLVQGAKVWPFIAWGLVPGLFGALLVLGGARLGWPVSWNRSFYRSVVMWPVLAFCVAWWVGATVHSGNPRPLPYIPLINPLEIIQAFILLVLIKAATGIKTIPVQGLDEKGYKMLSFSILGLMIFITTNAILARAVHYYAHVPFSKLGGSMLFQMALSLFWTLWAVGLTGAASKKGWRPVWFAGAVLIGIVTAKLFFVDLSHSGALWRVVSFIGAGVLMLVMGYTAPLPPQQIEEKSS